MNDAWMTVEVVERSQQTPEIVSLLLAHPDGEALPSFTAGAHLDVEAPNGMVRQYSLCNGPGETGRLRIGVLRDPASRGGSQSVHESLRIGSRLRVSTPKNHFALAPAARHSLLIAGGIGVTPILAMAEELAAQGASFEFHYCSRSAARTAFVDRLATCGYKDRVRFHFDDGPADQIFDIPSTLGPADGDRHLYVCGPKGFMDAVIDAAKERGWPAEQIHFEYFSAEAPSAQGAAFDVVVASSGQVIRVAEGVTVIEALRQQGVDVPVSCEQGVCGTCVTRVLEGVPEHRDLYLTDAERAKNDQFTPCCSRSCTARLVLDL